MFSSRFDLEILRCWQTRLLHTGCVAWRVYISLPFYFCVLCNRLGDWGLFSVISNKPDVKLRICSSVWSPLQNLTTDRQFSVSCKEFSQVIWSSLVDIWKAKVKLPQVYKYGSQPFSVLLFYLCNPAIGFCLRPLQLLPFNLLPLDFHIILQTQCLLRPGFLMSPSDIIQQWVFGQGLLLIIVEI